MARTTRMAAPARLRSQSRAARSVALSPGDDNPAPLPPPIQVTAEPSGISRAGNRGAAAQPLWHAESAGGSAPSDSFLQSGQKARISELKTRSAPPPNTPLRTRGPPAASLGPRRLSLVFRPEPESESCTGPAASPRLGRWGGGGAGPRARLGARGCDPNIRVKDSDMRVGGSDIRVFNSS